MRSVDLAREYATEVPKKKKMRTRSRSNLKHKSGKAYSFFDHISSPGTFTAA